MPEMVRTHMILPREVVEEFDRHCGGRKRSEQVAQLMADWSRREKMKEVVERFAGSLKEEDHPEWATREDVYHWVRAQRDQWPDRWATADVGVPEPGDDAAAAG